MSKAPAGGAVALTIFQHHFAPPPPPSLLPTFSLLLSSVFPVLLPFLLWYPRHLHCQIPENILGTKGAAHS